MSPQTEAEILDDLLDYVEEHPNVCIETERQSQTTWFRNIDGDWQQVNGEDKQTLDSWQQAKATHENEIEISILSKNTVKAILKANFYRLIPESKARIPDEDRPVWEDVEG
jgi:hypothetical protein